VFGVLLLRFYVCICWLCLFVGCRANRCVSCRRPLVSPTEEPRGNMNPTESFDADASAEASIISSPHSFTLDSLREQTISRPEHRRSDSSSSTITVIYSPIPSPCHQPSIATTQALSKSPESNHLLPASKPGKGIAPSKAQSLKENSPTTPASFTDPKAPLSNIGEASAIQDLQSFGPFTVPVRRRARTYSEQFPEFPTITPLPSPQGSQASSSHIASTVATSSTLQLSASSSLNAPRTHLRSASNGSGLPSPGYSSSTPPITKIRTRGRARSTTLTSTVNPLEEPITAEEQAVSNLAQAINRQNRREASFSKLYDSPIARAGTWSGGDQFRRSPLQQNPRGAAFRSPFKSRSPENTNPNSPEPFPVLAELPEQSYTPVKEDHKSLQ
jgi:hypothetical protein